jgi:HEAT repeat protein
MRDWQTTRSRGILLTVLVLSSLSGPGAGGASGEPSFEVEITTRAGGSLAPRDNSGLVGIEQTLLARVTPSVEGAEFEWSLDAPAIRTYEHDIQRADRHRPIPLEEADRTRQRFSFFWTRPQDGAEVSVRVRKGAECRTAKVAFNVRVLRDSNRDIYTFADNDPLRNPNGLSATYAMLLWHRNWHTGQKMSTGDRPVFLQLKDRGEPLVWGDVGYRDDPARMWGLDYNGGAFLRWHGAILGAHRAWRQTFHVPDFDAAPPNTLPTPEFFKRVPGANSAEKSRLFGYVRIGEFQDADELGKEVVHPWHNIGHVAVSREAGEPRVDDHSVSPSSRDDLFYRWHTIVDNVHRTVGPDQAVVTAVFPEDGMTVSDASSVYLAFDRKVSANAPASNTVQLASGKLTVNGRPATTIADMGGDRLPFVLYRLTGFPAVEDGPVKVELTGTPGYQGTSWSFSLKKGPGVDAVPAAFRRKAESAFDTARARQQKADIERLLTSLGAPDADAFWIGHLFRTYPLTAEEGIPILVQFLDHPSDHVKGYAIQVLHDRYGPLAKAALPKLVRVLGEKAPREWWVRERAARALGEIGPDTSEVLAALIDSLRDKEAAEPVNRGSIEALGRIGPRASEALPELSKYVASPDPETQFAAYRAVGQIAKAGCPSLEDLKSLEGVDWKAPDGGYAVFHAIQKAGPGAAFTVPALLATFRREPPTCVKAMILETLGKVGAGDESAVRLLVDTLPARWGTPGDPPAEKFFLDLARDSLARLTPSDPRAVTVLADALGHPDPVVRYQAALALRKFGAQAAQAVPALAEALRQADATTDPHQVGAYLDALRAMGADARPAGDILVELLSERSRLYYSQDKFWTHYLRAYLMVTLADIGVPDDAKPYILDMLYNSDKTMPHSYAAAARAAWALGPRMPEAVPGLIRSLKPEFADFPLSFDRFSIALGNGEISGRIEALRALARMGPKATAAVPWISALIVEKPGPDSVVPLWHEEARKALRAIRGVE